MKRRARLPHPAILAIAGVIAYIVGMAAFEWMLRPEGWIYLAP